MNHLYTRKPSRNPEIIQRLMQRFTYTQVCYCECRCCEYIIQQENRVLHFPVTKDASS